ncbi:hypothetical protein FAM09_09565 [Niastella caeni]|uniref:Uncharacterized protein n=1 Tax=Niastella caeni TaxID=2569763 RepID=A0A4S8HWQ2_9BACT|nr:hypothetical protein [Niastella caeni]THU40123.1 hypothetical protein FAM09_09565 [Niastella caeni]
MKKYLSFIIPGKPIIFCLLSFSILYPDIVFAYCNQHDTAYYYNERGKLLYRHVQATQPASYIIKTRKSFNQIFHDVPLDDSTIQVSADYNPATVIAISRPAARKVARRLRNGAVNDSLVMANIIPVLDKRIIRQMYDNIKSRCTASGPDGNEEHGGVVFPDGTVTCITGDPSDPRWFSGAALLIKEKALVYYHSHPDGDLEQQQSDDRADARNPNRVTFSQSNQVQLISYVQGPSRQDQEAVGEGMGYVFGMKAGGFIYIYDKEGVKATLPVRFVKKMKRSSNQKIKKIDSYFAGLLPALRLPYLF